MSTTPRGWRLVNGSARGIQRPQLSFWQIWNMSFGFLGIQFGWALQMANVSAIYEYLGADAHQIPILWLAAPLTELIVQPIIGHLSDHTWNRLGRRRPYFLTGALLASFALIAMPNSSALWMAAGLLWVMDASINISMEPFRAFVADLLPPEQRTSGFAMQSFFIGLGAVFASVLPFVLTHWFGLSDVGSTSSAIPYTIRLSFYLGAAVFFVAVFRCGHRAQRLSRRRSAGSRLHRGHQVGRRLLCRLLRCDFRILFCASEACALDRPQSYALTVPRMRRPWPSLRLPDSRSLVA